MKRREAIETILPLGWLFGAKDAGSLLPLDWNSASRVGLAKDLALLGFPIGCSPKPKTESPTSLLTSTQEPTPRTERKLSLKFVSPEQTAWAEVYLRSERISDINREPLEKMVNLLVRYGGVLPKKFNIVFQEESFANPLVLGMTNSESEEISISLGSLFSNPQKFVSEEYTTEAFANGVFAGEIFSLMFSECQCLPADMSVTKDNIEKMGDSFGMMVAAILSQRAYEQYVGDTNVFLYRGREPVFLFDPKTYEIFQQALSKPLLEFVKK